VLEFGNGRRERGVRFAEREQRGERKKCALHFVVDRKNAILYTESLLVLFFLRFNAMVDRDVMDQVFKVAFRVIKLIQINIK